MKSRWERVKQPTGLQKGVQKRRKTKSVVQKIREGSVRLKSDGLC